MSDEWGWSESKENPNDPEWHYEVAYFVDGERSTSWSAPLFGATLRYRKLSADEIARISRDKGEKWAKEEMEYSLLPVYSNEPHQCVKCGHDKQRVRVSSSGWSVRSYNDHIVLILSCKRCRHTWDMKPLDWENPR